MGVKKLVFFGAMNGREATVLVFTSFLCTVPRFRMLKLPKTGMVEFEPSSRAGDCLKKIKTMLNDDTLEVDMFRFTVW